MLDRHLHDLGEPGVRLLQGTFEDVEGVVRPVRLAVEVHRAGAARGRVAADVGAGEVELLPQRVDEQLAGLDLELPGG